MELSNRGGAYSRCDEQTPPLLVALPMNRRDHCVFFVQNAELVMSYRVSEQEDSVRSADGRGRWESAGTSCIEKADDGGYPASRFINFGGGLWLSSIVSFARVVILGNGVSFKTADEVLELGEPVSWACDEY